MTALVGFLSPGHDGVEHQHARVRTGHQIRDDQDQGAADNDMDQGAGIQVIQRHEQHGGDMIAHGCQNRALRQSAGFHVQTAATHVADPYEAHEAGSHDRPQHEFTNRATT